MKEEKFPLLKDVYGSPAFKEGLDNIVLSMENSMLFRFMGSRVPKSYLFEGPPGTGKTYAVRAIVNELSMRDNKEIAYLPYEIGLYGTAYINEGAKNVQKFFDAAFESVTQPSNDISKCVIFIDEVETIIGARGGDGMRSHKEDNKVTNTFMLNLQRIDSEDLPVYVFMATNFPELLDKAATRTGRVHEKLYFDLPDQIGREKLFEGYIDSFNTRAQYKMFRNIDVSNLARETEGFSCSDIEAVLDMAVKDKIYKEMKVRPKGIIPAYWMSEQWVLNTIKSIKGNKEIKSEKKPIGFMRD